MKRYISPYIFFIFLFLSLFLPKITLASSVYLSPVSGTFTTGSTFNVSILLDTKGKSINALQVFLNFPADKLQVVSPSTGQSIIDVWTVPPKFNNFNGTIDLEGGIPGGIMTSNGILTTIAFRVKSIGTAVINFSDKSRVFLNDGLATDSLSQKEGALYELKLPAPQGPTVVSDTHPDQSVWYPDRTAVLRFVNNNPVTGYSYTLSDDPDTNPDNISEGDKTSVAYNNLADGLHYFSVKALRDGVWGGTTHFAIRVDATPPAGFPVEILPSARTTSTKPVIQFTTTDANSGIDHYEIKLEPLSPDALKDNSNGNSNFFIESVSPFITSPLTLGSYNVVVRAYDKATNYREITKHLVITTPFFEFIADRGLQINNSIVIPWMWFWILGLILMLILGFTAYKVWSWHRQVHELHEHKKLPSDVLYKLEELKKYREKYGFKTLVAIFALLSCLSFHTVHADTLELTPPLITTFSENISNKEIFYVSGKTDVIDEGVVLYLQNLVSGETISETMQSDKNGDWFYRHNTFLNPGDYLLWTQSRSGDSYSPPSPQKRMSVKQTAITFGENRLSYEAIYLFTVIVLLLIVLGLAAMIVFHSHHGRRKHKAFQKSIRDAEESIHRGFTLLRHDIEVELSLIRKAKMSELMTAEEREKEAQLLADLSNISKHIGKEIWDIGQES